ncbi:MAG: ATP-binding protein [Phycisphaerae bacterium]|jgi:two-component system sensor histidine kinase HydH
MNVASTERTGPDLDGEGLAELLGAVNAVTARLEASHAELKARVASLTGELDQAHAQLERSRRLAALGEMAAGIAHEIRNPLGCIRLYASMIEQDLATAAPAQAKLAAKITAAGRVMESIVSDVLTFAREFRLRPAAVEPAAMVERALETCMHDGVPGWRDVRTSIETRGEATTLECDESLVRQALVNVIRNAFEAMAEAPGRDHRLTITIETREAIDASRKARRWVVMAVRDTGEGVSPEVIARMFNPFFTTRGAGTGLGLAIVHRIIDAHGGRIEVRNNAQAPGGGGPGAIFEIHLPACGDDAVRGSNALENEA